MSQLWMNAGDPAKMTMQPTMPEEEEVDDEDMGVAETYADYMPTKRTTVSFLYYIIILFVQLFVQLIIIKQLNLDESIRIPLSRPRRYLASSQRMSGIRFRYQKKRYAPEHYLRFSWNQ